LNAVGAVTRKYWRLIIFVLVLIVVFWLIWALRNVLLPFIVGFILAYLVLPLIRWVEKHLISTHRNQKLKQLRRISIIFLVYLLSLIIIGGVIFYIVIVVSNTFGTLTQDTSKIIPNGLAAIAQWLKSIPLLSKPSVQNDINTYVTKAEAALPNVLSGFLSHSVKFVQNSATLILGFIIMPVFVFLILKDWDTLRDKFYADLPQWSRKHTENIFSILQNSVIRYLRAKLILGLIVGVFVYILLTILRIDFALPLAVFAALMDLVPTIGPVLAGGLAVLVTLATAPDKFIWVGIGYVVIQLLVSNLIGLKIQGSQMKIHPAFIIMLTVLGAYFAGILGFIIVLPLTMTILGIFRYLRDTTHAGGFS